MSPEEFRAAGHELIDWLADQRLALETRPVLAQVRPGEVRAAFPAEPPLQTTDIGGMLDELERLVVPGITQIQHPMFFGWFPSNATLSSILGDIAASGLGTLGISWESCPALTEVEEVVCEWMRRFAGLSPRWRGAIHDTASSAALVALLVARERATGMSQNAGGLASVASAPVVYTTGQAHSSVAKAALLAGLGWDNIRAVAVDPETYAMLPDALAAAVAQDLAAGRCPAAVVATLGTTGTTAFDPLPAILEVAAAHDLWVHVDAAMAGAAMLLPECGERFAGVEDADSISWNPHKWMGTVLDCSLLYLRDTDLLQRVMSTNPSYLRSPADGEATQLRDWGIPLGRRFRALKLLFQLRMDGIEEIRARLRRDLANAEWLRAQVAAAPEWEVVAPVPLQTVCVRHRPVDAEGNALGGEALDAHTLGWVRRINDSGKAYLTASILDDAWMVRVSVGTLAGEREHVAALWGLMREAAGEQAGGD